MNDSWWKEKRNKIIGIILFLVVSAVLIWLISCEGCGEKREQFAPLEVVETTEEVSGENLLEETKEATETGKQPSAVAKNEQETPTTFTEEGTTETSWLTDFIQEADISEETKTTASNKPNGPSRPTTNPTQPNKPSQPTTNPSNPTQPSQPTTSPSNPTQPNKPSQPTTNPSNPTQPSQPTTSPSNPTQPNKPSQPTTNPSNPTQPSQPTTDPSDPSQSTDSTQPSKKDPTFTVPKDLKATYGDSLKDVKSQLGKGFEFEQALSTKVGNAGKQIFTVKYVPDDLEHYNVVKNIKVEINVAKATPSRPTQGKITGIYGQKLADIASQLEKGYSFEQSLSTSVGNAGSKTITVTYTPDDTANYNVLKGIEVPLHVDKALITITGVSFNDESFPYNPSRTYSINIIGTLPPDVTVTYRGNNRVNQGNWQVIADFSCDENHILNITSMTATMRIWDDPANPGSSDLLSPDAPDVPGSSGILTPDGGGVGQG